MKIKELPKANKENEESTKEAVFLNCNFHKEFRHFNTSVGFITQEKYCQCGRLVQPFYKDRLTNFKFKSNNHLYELDKLTNEILELDQNAVYLTKKSFMLNQFLERVDTTNVPAINASENTNRFETTVANNKCQLKGAASFSVVDMQNEKNARTVNVPSPAFSDKRLVSLFRSVALYWFFCLNTVLTKGDVCKKKNLTTVDVRDSSGILTTFDSNILEFKISPELLENYDNIANDIFWRVISDAIRCGGDEKCRHNGSLLSYDEHSRKNLLDKMLQHWYARFANVFADLFRVKSSNNCCRVPVPAVRDGGSHFTTMERIRGKKYVLCDSGTTNLGLAFRCYEPLVAAEITRNVQWRRKSGLPVSSKMQIDKLSEDDDDDEFHRRKKDTVDESPNLDNVDSTNRRNDEIFTSVVLENLVLLNSPNRVKKLQNEKELEKRKIRLKSQLEHNVGVSTSFINDEYYFLPKGMFNNVDENEYPQYNLWCSPLLMSDVLPRNSFKNKMPKKVERSSTIVGSGGGGGAAAAFKPYRLWESSFAAEDDYIPKFGFKEEFSVFSIPYYPKQPNKINVDVETSAYSLWGSPNIIDFLPRGVGCLRFTDDDYSGNTSSSSSSSDSLEIVYEPLEIVESSRPREKYAARKQLLNLKPVVNRFAASFTDRGAFEYYKKPKKTPLKAMYCGLELTFGGPTRLYIDSKPILADDTEEEIQRISKMADNSQKNELNSAYYFKPIQPAIKVETDAPPMLERSQSGTYYHLNDRRLLPFKHELDVNNEDAKFQPKYVVSANDKACQTETFAHCSNRMYGRISSAYIQSANRKKIQQEMQNQYQNALFLYSLEEVFDFFGKPGLDNINVKAHVDFSRLF